MSRIVKYGSYKIVDLLYPNYDMWLSALLLEFIWDVVQVELFCLSPILVELSRSKVAVASLLVKEKKTNYCINGWSNWPMLPYVLIHNDCMRPIWGDIDALVFFWLRNVSCYVCFNNLIFYLTVTVITWLSVYAVDKCFSASLMVVKVFICCGI